MKNLIDKVEKLTKEIIHFKRWLKKSIEYSIFLWDDQDFDSEYLLELILFKLKRMDKVIISYGRPTREMKKCIQLLEFIKQNRDKPECDAEIDEALEQFCKKFAKYGFGWWN